MFDHTQRNLPSGQLFDTRPACPAGSADSSASAGFELVGAAGFEPATTRTPSVCATRLRHAPTEMGRRMLRRSDGRLLVPPTAGSARQLFLRLFLGRDARTPLPIRSQIDRERPR